jgi:hypothetical protein
VKADAERELQDILGMLHFVNQADVRRVLVRHITMLFPRCVAHVSDVIKQVTVFFYDII